MKALKTLIRLHKRELDRLRRDVILLETKKNNLQFTFRKLGDQLARELKLAMDLAEMRGFFGNFSEHIRQRREQITEQILRVDEQIEQMNLAIFAEFSELKKFEITLDRRMQAQRELADKREQAELDNVGIQIHARQESA